MARWLDLFDEVRSATGQVPSHIAERHIRYATIELCRYAPVWQRDYIGAVPMSPDGIRSIPLVATAADAESVMQSFGYDPSNPTLTPWIANLPSNWQFDTDGGGAGFIAGLQMVRSIRQPIGAITAAQFTVRDNTGIATFGPERQGTYILFGVPEDTPDINSVLAGEIRRDQFSSFVRAADTVDVDGVTYKVWHSRTAWSLRGMQRFQVMPITQPGGTFVDRFLAQAKVPGAVQGVEWLRIRDNLWTKSSIKNVNLIRSEFEDRRDSAASVLNEDRGYAYEPPIGDSGGRLYFAPWITGTEPAPYEMRLVLKPTVLDAELADEAAYLLVEYRETIVAGASYRLLSMAKEPWTNARAASVQHQMWEDGLESAKLRGEGRRNAISRRTRYGGIQLAINGGITPGLTLTTQGSNRYRY